MNFNYAISTKLDDMLKILMHCKVTQSSIVKVMLENHQIELKNIWIELLASFISSLLAELRMQQI